VVAMQLQNMLIVGYLPAPHEVSNGALAPSIAVIDHWVMRVSDHQLDNILSGDLETQTHLDITARFMMAAEDVSDIQSHTFMTWSLCDSNLTCKFLRARIKTQPGTHPSATEQVIRRHSTASALMNVTEIQCAALMLQDFALVQARIEDIRSHRALTHADTQHERAAMTQRLSCRPLQTQTAAGRLIQDQHDQADSDQNEAAGRIVQANDRAKLSRTSGAARRRSQRNKPPRDFTRMASGEGPAVVTLNETSAQQPHNGVSSAVGYNPDADMSAAVTGTPIPRVLAQRLDGTPDGEHNRSAASTGGEPGNLTALTDGTR